MSKKPFKTWGETLFPPPIVGRVTKVPKIHTAAGVRPKPKATPKNTSQKQNQQGALTPKIKAQLMVKKAPEVMVKISGCSKGMSKLKNHVDYVSRNGSVELESQDGLSFTGKGAAQGILNDWKDNQQIPDMEQDGKRREALHVILSMTENTDRDAVKNAARAFAQQTFEGHEWLMAEHRDEAHPHVHFVVKMADEYGHRLNPKKADLQLWRETFAEKLQENGIEANATKRQVRGRARRPKTQAQYHALKNKRPLRNDSKRRKEVVDAAKAGQAIPDHPNIKKARSTRLEVQQNANNFINELKSTGELKLAEDLNKHFANLPQIRSEQQQALADLNYKLANMEKSKSKKDR